MNTTHATFGQFYSNHMEFANMIIQRKSESIATLERHITIAKTIIVQRLGDAQA